ncbi:hypothetical protein AVEN_149865-1 [Araneus ventricosus]|uniref:Uncharacterized protein n=1 Tax=Araneus ventricosus TaxID=182803 RepID=A0A4Y2DZT6_ARAVE|nr:hypothetical protein AVEN_149865-1 [Araneus ventricosus]
MRAKMDTFDKNAESNVDTSEILINENGATNDEPNIAVDNFSLSDELHGPESLPNYGESTHSTPTKSREDVLKRVLNKLHTECEKESPVSAQSDKDQHMSDDSEDSTDIFSQSVPPTPPDNASFKNDTVFKSSHYKHN